MARKKKEENLSSTVKFSKKYNIAEKTINKIAKFLGEFWESELHENPYIIMRCDGFGFYRADVIAKKLGIENTDPRRVKAYVGNEADFNQDGSTLIEFDKMCKKTAKDLCMSASEISDIIIDNECEHYTLLNKRYGVYEQSSEKPEYVTSPQAYDCELWFCKTLKEIAHNFESYIEDDIVDNIIYGSGLNSDQESVVIKSLKSGITVLTGKAGSGKSYTARKILETLEAHKKSYVCLAPTGIASKVFKSSTGRECSTIHRRYYNEFKKDGEGIEADVLILEESGMYSIQHIDLIRRMLTKNVKQIIFIGDIYQLTPISQGCFLYSTIGMINNSRINGQVFELTKVMRTGAGSTIPKFASYLCGGADSSKLTEISDGDLEFKTIGNLPTGKQIENIMFNNGFEFENTYILSAMKVRDGGTDEINKYFQDKNKGSVVFKDNYNCFKIGDIVMQTKNNYDLKIFNGEKLTIIGESYGRIMCEKIEDGIMVTYDYDDVTNNIMLSYANTVHKTQGLTVENVIFVVSAGQSFMLNRNLLYTGVTRASKRLVILRDDGIIKQSSFKNLIDKRVTITRKFAKII